MNPINYSPSFDSPSSNMYEINPRVICYLAIEEIYHFLCNLLFLFGGCYFCLFFPLSINKFYDYHLYELFGPTITDVFEPIPLLLYSSVILLFFLYIYPVKNMMIRRIMFYTISCSYMITGILGIYYCIPKLEDPTMYIWIWMILWSFM